MQERSRAKQTEDERGEMNAQNQANMSAKRAAQSAEESGKIKAQDQASGLPRDPHSQQRKGGK